MSTPQIAPAEAPPVLGDELGEASAYLATMRDQLAHVPAAMVEAVSAIGGSIDATIQKLSSTAQLSMIDVTDLQIQATELAQQGAQLCQAAAIPVPDAPPSIAAMAIALQHTKTAVD